MPTTLSGLFLFVVLLLPGFAFFVGRERHTSGQQFSAFRETAIVVAASLSSELIVLVIFTVLRVLLPGLTPDVGALVRDSGGYLRGGGRQPGHYGQVAIWAVAMLAAAVALAYSWSVPEIRARVRELATNGKRFPKTRNLIGDALGEYPHESNASAWWVLFDSWAEGNQVGVRCILDDGSYVEGGISAFSREADDKPERDLILVEPISFRPAGSGEVEQSEASAVCVSASRIVTMFVTYWQKPEVTSPAVSAEAPAAEMALPEQPSAAVVGPPSGPS
jgi:Family of unknown function (DUF6338)